MDNTTEVGQDTILIIGVVTETIWDVIRGMGDKIITIMEGKLKESKLCMKETGVGHMISKIETEGMIWVLVIVDWGQVWGQVQIEIGLDVSSA